jgi:hypothetical protein
MLSGLERVGLNCVCVQGLGESYVVTCVFLDISLGRIQMYLGLNCVCIQGYVEDYTGNNMTLTDTLTGNVIQANTITIGQGDGGEGITVDGHIESDTFKARQHLYTPQGYVEEYTGNSMTLTDTLTGNVIQANTITIGQGDGGEGITVDGHIESDTFKARQHLYTPQGYVEDYTGNNMTLTDTLTGNVINVSNTITSPVATSALAVTVPEIPPSSSSNTTKRSVVIALLVTLFVVNWFCTVAFCNTASSVIIIVLDSM